MNEYWGRMVDTDSPDTVWELWEPTDEQRLTAEAMKEEYWQELAGICFDYDFISEWTSDDWDSFKEAMLG